MGIEGVIVDRLLRNYIACRLGGDIDQPKEDIQDKNAYRDLAIAGYLIRPLVLDGFIQQGMQPPEASDKGECACSIVSQALKGIGVHSLRKRAIGDLD